MHACVAGGLTFVPHDERIQRGGGAGGPDPPEKLQKYRVS